MSSLQENRLSSQNSFNRFGEDVRSIEESLGWVCSIAGQLGDAFMVFARWQCLGLGGERWRTSTDGRLFNPGDDEWLTYFHPEDQGRVALGLADPTVNTFPDVRILSPDDDSYQLASMRMFFPPFETEQHLFAIVFSLKESTEPNLAEVASFNQSEHMLSSSTAEVVEISRSSGTVKNCSLSFEEANHLAENEVIGKAWITLELMEEAYAAMLLAKIKGHTELKNYPAVLRSREGHAREMLIDVLPSLDDEDNVVLTFKDVTSHNYACRHLHEVIDHLPFGVFTRGIENGKYQLSNTSANRILNSGAPLRGLEDEDLFAENDIAKILSNLNVDPDSGGLNSLDPIILEEGHKEIQYLPMTDRSGRVNRVVGVVREVEETCAADAPVLGLNESSLINVGHEMRTPMNAILGFTSLLADTALQAEQKEMLETVRASGEALSNTVDLMLELAALNSSDHAAETDLMDIESLLENLGEAYATKAVERGLCLSVEVDPQIPAKLEADATKLNHLMENLVENALKFTPKGEVGIQADLIELVDDLAVIQLSVFDTGIGISREKQTLIFEAFQQADSSDTRPYEGTGIGLTVSDRIAQVMGSRIELQSELGEGSVFSVQLKLKVQADTRLAEAAPCPDRLAVAIFAREKAQGDALLRMLSVWGAEVSITTSCEDFSAALESSSRRSLGLAVWSQGVDALSDAEAAVVVQLAKEGKTLILTNDDSAAAVLAQECGVGRVVPSLVRSTLLRSGIIDLCSTSVEEERRATPAQPFRGRCALVIDDRSDERRNMISRLVRWGIEVDISECERTANEMINSKVYDVIFFEANYLGKDTAAMIQGLRLQLDDESSTTFVGLAISALETVKGNLKAADVAHFLKKPTAEAELKAMLQRIL